MPAFSLLIILLIITKVTFCLVPPKFQWKQIDYAWQSGAREKAISSGAYVPENNLPIGIARWEDKLFITVPRWKSGVPSSLNYIDINGSEDQPLQPYPSWGDSFVTDNSCCIPSNSTVVSTFRVHVDHCGRLWVVDTGVADIAGVANQVTNPAIVIFDLKSDQLIRRHELDDRAIKGPESFFTSITVEITTSCDKSFAYIPDMGASSLVVYSLEQDTAWRITHPYFHFDPHAGTYSVAGLEFYWSDGISAVALSAAKNDGFRDLYFHPVSSTKEFKISTKLLRDIDLPQDEMFNGVQILGDRGPKSQSTACDLDQINNILFYTQISKNGIGCWNIDKPFTEENNPVIASDCNMLEFPNDIKVDNENNLWVLSDRMPRFLYDRLDQNQVNFRILTAPVSQIIQGTACEKLSAMSRVLSFITGN